MEKGRTIDVILLNSVELIAGNYENFKRFSLKTELKKGLNEILHYQLPKTEKKRLTDYRGLVLISEGKHERFNWSMVGADPDIRFSRTYGTSEQLRDLENRIPDYFNKPLDDPDEKKETYLHLLHPDYKRLFESCAADQKIKTRFIEGKVVDTILFQHLEFSPELRNRLGVSKYSTKELLDLLKLDYSIQRNHRPN